MMERQFGPFEFAFPSKFVCCAQQLRTYKDLHLNNFEGKGKGERIRYNNNNNTIGHSWQSSRIRQQRSTF